MMNTHKSWDCKIVFWEYQPIYFLGKEAVNAVLDNRLDIALEIYKKLELQSTGF